MSGLLLIYRRPTVAVDKLPNELLVDIFLRHNISASGNDRSLPQRAYPCNGFNLMLVCHHWRDLAVSTPCLWQAIKLRGNVEWFSRVLSRSKGLPLDLVIHRFASNSNISTCSRCLSPQFHRVRSIHFPAMHVQIRLLNAVFGRHMPLLTDLDILVKSGGPLDLSPDRLPALRALRISSCAISWSPAMLSSLCCLHLDECTCQDETVTLNDLLDVVVGAGHLQDLRLRNFLSVLHEPSAASETRQPIPILIPKLLQLDIYDLPHLVSQFLSFVRLSSATDVRITGLILAPVPDTTDAFLSLLPHDTSGLPLLHLVVAGRIKNSLRSICSIEGRMEQHSVGPQITLSLHWAFNPEGPFATEASSYLERTLCEFAVVFSAAPPESLEIDGKHSHVHHLDAWARLFTAFPAIQHLELKGNNVPLAAVAAFGQALYDESESGPDTDIEAAAEADDIDEVGMGAALVLPKLRSLYIGPVNWSPGLVETLAMVLQRRVAKGLPTLEYLDVDWRKMSDEKGLKRTMKVYRKILKSLVEAFAESFTLDMFGDSESEESGTGSGDESSSSTYSIGHYSN